MNFLKNFNRRDILRKEAILEHLYIRLHNQEFRSSKTTNYSPSGVIYPPFFITRAPNWST